MSGLVVDDAGEIAGAVWIRQPPAIRDPTDLRHVQVHHVPGHRAMLLPGLRLLSRQDGWTGVDRARVCQPSIRAGHPTISTLRSRGGIRLSDGNNMTKAIPVRTDATHTGPRSLEPDSATAPIAGPAAAPILSAAVA